MGRKALEPGTAGTASITGYKRTIGSDGKYVLGEPVERGANWYIGYQRLRDTNGNTKVIKRTGYPKGEVQAALKLAVTEALAAGNKDVTPATTVGELITLLMERKADQATANTMSTYAANVSAYFSAKAAKQPWYIGNLAVRNVTTNTVETFLHAIASDVPAGKPYKVGAAKTSRTLLAQALKIAVKANAIPVNPATGADLPKQPASIAAPRTRDSITWEEYLTLQQVADEQDADPTLRRKGWNYAANKPAKDNFKHNQRSRDLGDLVAVLFHTGARYGEALALTWADIDLVGDDEAPGYITIGERTVTYVVGRVPAIQADLHGDTKAGDGALALPIPTHIVDRLKRRRERLQAKGYNVFPTGTVFPALRKNKHGEVPPYRDPNNIQKQFKELYEDAGLAGEGVAVPVRGTHIARKSFITWATNQNIHPRHIANMVRQRNVDIAMNVYADRNITGTGMVKFFNEKHS